MPPYSPRGRIFSLLPFRAAGAPGNAARHARARLAVPNALPVIPPEHRDGAAAAPGGAGSNGFLGKIREERARAQTSGEVPRWRRRTGLASRSKKCFRGPRCRRSSAALQAEYLQLLKKKCASLCCCSSDSHTLRFLGGESR